MRSRDPLRQYLAPDRRSLDIIGREELGSLGRPKCGAIPELVERLALRNTAKEALGIREC